MGSKSRETKIVFNPLFQTSNTIHKNQKRKTLPDIISKSFFQNSIANLTFSFS